MSKQMFSKPLREECLYGCRSGNCNCYERRQAEGAEIAKAIEEGRPFEGFEWCGCPVCNDEDNWTMKMPPARVIKFHDDHDPKPQPSDFLTLPCACGCCHSGDLGACDDYTLGGNERCVYCDHGEACHERDRGRKFFNGPISYGIRTATT